MERHSEQARAHVVGGCDERTAMDAVQAGLMDEVCALMEGVTLSTAHRNYCHQCGKWCRLYPEVSQTSGKTTIAIAGTSCVTRSPVGKKAGWVASTMLPFVAWLFSVRSWMPTLIVHECTPRFDADIFKRVFNHGGYEMQSFSFSPQRWVCR